MNDCYKLTAVRCLEAFELGDLNHEVHRIIKRYITLSKRLWVGGCCLIGEVCQEQPIVSEKNEDVGCQDLGVGCKAGGKTQSETGSSPS